jgi:hypothetical protein
MVGIPVKIGESSRDKGTKHFVFLLSYADPGSQRNAAVSNFDRGRVSVAPRSGHTQTTAILASTGLAKTSPA